MSLSNQIVFSWNGLPQYAARLVRAAIERLNMPSIVIGSRPEVPIEGMEVILNSQVLWVDSKKIITWNDIGCKPPKVYIQSGWSYQAFSSLGKEAKAAGSLVIGLSDANWRGDFRQLFLGPIAFRLLYKRHFDAIIVPGRQGFKLMRYFGFPRSRIRLGMYGADSNIFNGGSPIIERPKTFLYVGQFVERKNILILTKAFLKFSENVSGWTLRLVGSGHLRDQIPTDPRVVVESFVQPEKLCEYYRNARFFILPSSTEAWGLVVHEAALSGCGLLLSDAIGSKEDLASEVNSIEFKANNTESIARALTEASTFDHERLIRVEAESRRLAEQFGPHRFAEEVESILKKYINHQ
jgi:glycosyltransferase involved in cell wall biosynthesis